MDVMLPGLAVFIMPWLLACGLVTWWAAAWGRSIGWAMLGAFLLSPLVWAIVLMVLGRNSPEPERAIVVDEPWRRAPPKPLERGDAPIPVVSGLATCRCGHMFRPSAEQLAALDARCPRCRSRLMFAAPTKPSPQVAPAKSPANTRAAVKEDGLPSGNFRWIFQRVEQLPNVWMETHIAGLRRRGMAGPAFFLLAERHLRGADRPEPWGIRLRRELANNYDTHAVAVDGFVGDQVFKIGFLPQEYSEEVAEHLDAGLDVDARLLIVLRRSGQVQAGIAVLDDAAGD